MSSINLIYLTIEILLDGKLKMNLSLSKYTH